MTQNRTLRAGTTRQVRGRLGVYVFIWESVLLGDVPSMCGIIIHCFLFRLEGTQSFL